MWPIEGDLVQRLESKIPFRLCTVRFEGRLTGKNPLESHCKTVIVKLVCTTPWLCIGGGSTGQWGQLPPYSGNYGGNAPVQNTVVMITVVNNCK